MDFQTLNTLLKCGINFSHRKSKRIGISDTECQICSYVAGNPGCSQDDVAGALFMDKTTIAKSLVTLEEKKFISRKRSAADNRRKELTITKEGLDCCAEVLNIHELWMKDILSVLSEEEQAQFSSYCMRLIQAAEEKMDRELASGDAGREK